MIELLIFTISSRCNARCAMCHMWQRKDSDIPLEKVREVLSSKAIRDSLINLVPTGGEPTLRDDLPEIFRFAYENLPRLAYTGFFTNSLLPQKARAVVKESLELKKSCRREDVGFSVGLSLDGLGQTHDEIRGVKGAFGKVMENYMGLKALTREHLFQIGFNFVVQKENIASGSASLMLDVAEQALLPILFPPVYGKDIFYNKDAEGDWAVEQGMKEHLVGFYRDVIDRAARGRLLADNGTYYSQLLRQMEGGQRTLPCLFREKKACVIDADGSAYLCDVTKESLLGNIYETGFDEIWNSPRKEEAYERMLPYCSTCFSNCAVASGRYQLRSIWETEGVRGIARLSLSEISKRLRRMGRIAEEYKYAIWPRL
ncbi:MAG: radical SAM protein [Nitrospirales bacterium]|nr:radical SAM protein [Nitrospirales bacterium]